MVKVMFFSYLVDTLEFIEDTKVFKSASSFRASLTRRRRNPRFYLVDYNILWYTEF
jgi:hypothetical protein